MLERDFHAKFDDTISVEMERRYSNKSYTSPISSSEAFYQSIGNYNSSDIELVTAKFSPETATNILDHLGQNLKNLIFDIWPDTNRIIQLYNGTTTVSLNNINDLIIDGATNDIFISIQSLVDITNIQHDELYHRYVIHTETEKIVFTEEEIAFTIRTTPIDEGMAGIFKNLVILNSIRSNQNLRNGPQIIEMIAAMDCSGMVIGAASYLERIINALYTTDGGLTTGIESEVLVAYNIFQEVRDSNKLCNPNDMNYLHISRNLLHREADVTIFYLNKENERIPIEMVETKTKIGNFKRKLLTNKGKNQIRSYFRECLQYPISRYEACPFKIYITGSLIPESQESQFHKIRHPITKRRALCLAKRLLHSQELTADCAPEQTRARGSELNAVCKQLIKIYGKIRSCEKHNMSLNVQLLFFNKEQNRFVVVRDLTLE